MAKKQSTKISYENAMKELQEIVTNLQNEVTSVDELSEKVKRAAELIEYCKTKLRSTEESIDKLFEG